jgi:hypothetical protein
MTAIDLQLPAVMRSNLLTLQVTQERISASQQRLATGLKVNTALDSPPVYFAARGLTQRAGDLTAMKDQMGQAISTVKAADRGVTGIESLLQQARVWLPWAPTTLRSAPGRLWRPNSTPSWIRSTGSPVIPGTEGRIFWSVMDRSWP